MYVDEDQISEVLAGYYQNLFQTGVQTEPILLINKVEKLMSEEMVNILVTPFCGEEVKDALAQMHPTKAPGSNGVSVIFFKNYGVPWHMI